MTKRILFIDDEPEFVDPQIWALREAGYEVKLETAAETALVLLQKEKFDLIILDLIMPARQDEGEASNIQESDFAETGLRLHETIREELGINQVPILFLTVVRDQDILRAIREREKRFNLEPRILMKPSRPSDVVEEVQEVLGDPTSPPDAG